MWEDGWRGREGGKKADREGERVEGMRTCVILRVEEGRTGNIGVAADVYKRKKQK